MANTGHEKPRRIGVFDLGSNTILLLVMGADGRVVRDVARITRLGQGVFERGELAPEAIARTQAAIAEFAAQARADGVERLVAVGTEALRRARDGAEFLAGLVRAGTVDGARLLSGDEEAELTLEATRLGVGEQSRCDRGDRRGGRKHRGRLARDPRAVRSRGLSLPLGSVRLTEAHLPRHPIPPADLARAARARGRRSPSRSPARSRTVCPRTPRWSRSPARRPRSRRSSSRSIPTIRRGSKGSRSTPIGSRTGSSGSPRWASRRASACPGSSPAART